MNVLEVKNLRKSLGKREVIKGIDFSIKEREIFGFLGPNGAGKTTTIKMIVGLIKPDSGTITINGADIVKNGNAARAQIGAVVENPELYTYLSGMANLKMIAEIRKLPKKSILDVVDIVGLTDRINDNVGSYSLGMKQRLGLACALIGKPKLLILDEPTNGLDPTGIIDFRRIVKNAAKEFGTAVFISSHILSEVQQLCTKVAFINDGEIKAVEELFEGEVGDRESIRVVINPAYDISSILKGLDGVYKFEENEGKYDVVAKKGYSAEIIRSLVAKDIEVFEVYKKQNSLEEKYLELVKGVRG